MVIYMKNIVLIGMPGAGKSTVGVVLAKNMGMSFMDSDLVIQEQEGKKLHEIIEECGSDGFLKVEERINASLNPTNTVIATGGSVVYGAKAMELALEGKFGVLTVIKNGKLDSVSLEDVVGNNTKIGAVSGNTAESNIRKVTMDHDLVKTARDIGICLGD